MIDQLIDYFLSKPRRLVAVGVALIRVGGFLLVAGLVSQADTTAMSAVTGAARVDVPLTDVLPDALSFWVPESALGFGFALLLLATGLVVDRTGRVYERFMGA